MFTVGHAGQLTLQVRLIRSNAPQQPGTISIEVTEQSNLFSILKITNLRLLFDRADFKYIEKDDEYRCPAGERLAYRTTMAKMVVSPEDYEWSSYRCNELRANNMLINPHDLYLRLGEDKQQRLAAYASLFTGSRAQQDINLMRDATNKCWVFGSREFLSRISGPAVNESR